MQPALLTTKLYVPPRGQNQICRPQLADALSRGLICSLTLVSAPAGYGKTTLVSSWLSEISIPSAWISLDEGDNDSIRFLQYFLSALHEVVPNIRLDLLGMLQGKHTAYLEALMILLINEITDHAEPFVIVMDDFQTIQAQPILEMVSFLLEHMPPQMHLVLLSRTDPPAPLSRLRARNQLIEIRADQLRFKPDETTVYLNEVMGLNLSADDIAAMEARTEGWIAGLQLAALSMRGCGDVHKFVSAFTGSHFYIMDYLAEEVLNRQSPELRSFLLKTSILDRLCASLCDAVIDEGNSSLVCRPSSEILESLHHANLFLIPLDFEGSWYRYHHLFSDVLNRRLEQLFPHLIPDLHRRASLWYEQNGWIDEAIHHALMAGDQERAAQMVEQYGCHLLMRGEVTNLLNWIEAVEPHAQTLPWVAVQKAWALCLAGRLDLAEQAVQTSEQLVSLLEPTGEVRTMLGAIAAARAYRSNLLGKTRLAEDFAHQALEYLADSDPFTCSLKGAATSILGDASWLSGSLEKARRAYMEAVLISQASGNIDMTIIANANLADILREQGRLHQAARIYSDTLRLAALPNGQTSPLADRVYAGLSKVAYEWNQLDVAAQHVQKCIELSLRWGSIECQVTGHLILARLELAWCNPEGAQKAIHAAEELAQECSFSPWRSNRLNSALARIWLAQGSLEKAARLVHLIGITYDGVICDGEIPYDQEPMVFTLLRLLQAQGEYDRALALSERLLRSAEAANRTGRVIQILVLQALALQEKKDTAQALAALKKALALAEPECYLRTFLDEGDSMARLLYQAKYHGFGNGFVSELFSEMRSSTGSKKPPGQLLIEPLTLRELEVLKLIESGYSNGEIADQLVISLPTVKRHISNVYAKLSAKSRTQAVCLARELKLFE